MEETTSEEFNLHVRLTQARGEEGQGKEAALTRYHLHRHDLDKGLRLALESVAPKGSKVEKFYSHAHKSEKLLIPATTLHHTIYIQQSASPVIPGQRRRTSY